MEHRGPPHRGGPKSGETMTGMVKSYNRKGFGFIMCQTMDQDIYFSRESLHPQLQTSDLAGESVTFEVHRFPDGKLQARNLRPVGDVTHLQGRLPKLGCMGRRPPPASIAPLSPGDRDRGKGSKGLNPFAGK